VKDLLLLSAIQQANLIRTRKVSSLELVQAHIEQISKVNPQINAAVEIFTENALAEARSADKKMASNGSVMGPLHGVPFSIKDSIEVAGTIVRRGRWGAQPRRDLPRTRPRWPASETPAPFPLPKRIFPICYSRLKVTTSCLAHQ
jgi:hypothetical protein